METINKTTSILNTVDLESRIEQTILRSSVPININENEEITVLGQRGVWANRSEVLNWNGPIPISQYKLNDDPHPEIIHKTNSQPVEYTQDIQVRYLRPPTPQAPGELIIRQENSLPIGPAPPQIIRQHAPRPQTPEPLIIREAPPEPPVVLPRKIVTIPSQATEAPPRKVIIEKLPALPAKPQPVIIERWLPYKEQKRRVIYQPAQSIQQAERVRNLIVQWQSPQPNIKKNIQYMGVVNADPREYIAKYGSSLKRSHEMPSFVVEMEGQNGYKKYVQEQGTANELEGDIDALKYLDLEREGLGIYRNFIASRGIQISTNGAAHTSVIHTTSPGRVITEVYATGTPIYTTASQQNAYFNAAHSNLTQY